MKVLKFKTNIKCLGCVAKVTPHIQNAGGIESWEVDITKPDKILTVKGDVSAEEVAAVVAEAGFQAQEVVSAV